MTEAKLQEWTKQIKSIKDQLSSEECNTLFHSERYYDDFYKKSNEQLLIMEWYQKHSWREIVQKLILKFPAKTNLRLLSIGCGRGIQEIELLKQMSREFGHLNFTAVEPTNEAKMVNHALMTTKELKNVQFSWAKEKLEDFRNGPCREQKYHVITVIHSLYYLGDVEENLAYFLSAIEEGGFLIVCLVSESSRLVKMWFDKPWLNAASVGKINSERVHSFAQQAGYNVKTIKIPSIINITSVFDENSTEGAALLDFMTRIPQFNRLVPDDIKSDLLEYLESADISMKTDDGLTVMGCDGELLIIEKTL